jgi:hypothetical protein
MVLKFLPGQHDQHSSFLGVHGGTLKKFPWIAQRPAESQRGRPHPKECSIFPDRSWPSRRVLTGLSADEGVSSAQRDSCDYTRKQPVIRQPSMKIVGHDIGSFNLSHGT